jgi:hypothetical protein
MDKKLKEAIDKIHETKDRLNQEIKRAFLVGVKMIIEKYPTLQEIYWTQYTQYFNDGNECHFNVHGDDCGLIFEDNNKKEILEHWDYFDSDNPYYKDSKKIRDEFKEFIYMFSEEDMKSIFGDHIKIRCSAEEIKIEKYEDHE